MAYHDSQGGVITGLQPRRGRADRVVAVIDGHLRLELPREVAEKAQLAVGARLDGEHLDALVRQDLTCRARDKAVALLAVRERTCREVEARLTRAGFPPEVAAETVSWLMELGYLDDRRFALDYVSNAMRAGWGPARLRSELQRRGVGRDIVEEVLAEVALERQQKVQDWSQPGCPGDTTRLDHLCLETVATQVRRRFGRMFARDPETAKRRAAGFMLRRGHDWEAVTKVLALLEQETADSSGTGEDSP